MVKIRLSKTGTKHKNKYRIVAIDSRKKGTGKNLEVLGFIDPTTKPPSLRITQTRFDYWVSQGAQVTLAVKKFLAK